MIRQWNYLWILCRRELSGRWRQTGSLKFQRSVVRHQGPRSSRFGGRFRSRSVGRSLRQVEGMIRLWLIEYHVASKFYFSNILYLPVRSQVSSWLGYTSLYLLLPVSFGHCNSTWNDSNLMIFSIARKVIWSKGRSIRDGWRRRRTAGAENSQE